MKRTKSQAEIHKSLFETDSFQAVVEVSEALYRHLLRPSKEEFEEDGRVTLDGDKVA